MQTISILTGMHISMEKLQLDALYSWFDGYVEPFLITDDEGARTIRLKIVHTRKVCEPAPGRRAMGRVRGQGRGW
jgi:hypothetical protein